MKNGKLGLVGKIACGIASLVGSASKVDAQTGKLSIDNHIDAPYTNQTHMTLHRSGALEGIDSYDSPYTALFNPSGIAAKIISKVEAQELDIDQRPENSTSNVNLELSLISSNGQPITINSTNELRCNLPLAGMGYDFGTKPITIQQYDPDNTSRKYPLYDVRRLIALGSGTGIIPLPQLNGTFNSEDVYAKLRLRFDRHSADLNDSGQVNWADFSVFASHWLDSNCNVENAYCDGADLDQNGQVNWADFSIFASQWLYGSE